MKTTNLAAVKIKPEKKIIKIKYQILLMKSWLLIFAFIFLSYLSNSQKFGVPRIYYRLLKLSDEFDVIILTSSIYSFLKFEDYPFDFRPVDFLPSHLRDYSLRISH